MIFRKSGFTLIELIIVVIIIGILASIAAPMMGGVQAKAICAEAITAMGTIRSALQAYYAEYDGLPGTEGCPDDSVYVTEMAPLMREAGLPVDDDTNDSLKGKYFNRYNYHICLQGNSPITNVDYVLAAIPPELKIHDDNVKAPYLIMYFGGDGIKQDGMSRTGYPHNDLPQN